MKSIILPLCILLMMISVADAGIFSRIRDRIKSRGNASACVGDSCPVRK